MLKERDITQSTKILNLCDLSLFLNRTNSKGKAETIVYKRRKKNKNKVVVPIQKITKNKISSLMESFFEWQNSMEKRK